MKEEMNWFASFPKELKKFRGKHVALLGRRVVAHGDDAITVLKKLERNFREKPVLAFIPKEETLILLVI